MTDETAPVWLRPIHWWFFWWEEIIPSLYRVVAVGVGAVITATALALIAGTGWVVASLLATVGWIVLAILQDRDQRVHLDVNDEFQALLRDRADPALARAGFVFNLAQGPCRARSDRSDTFLYEADNPAEGCIDLWIRRHRSGGPMEVSVDGRPLERLVVSHGHPQLAARVTRAERPADDVTALVAAFALVLPELSR